MGHSLSQGDMSRQGRKGTNRQAARQGSKGGPEQGQVGNGQSEQTGCEEGEEEHPTRKAAATRVVREGPSYHICIYIYIHMRYSYMDNIDSRSCNSLYT